MLFAISDLHLSFTGEKPMRVFGDKWNNHTDKLLKNWKMTVGPDDAVIISGDISWAKKLQNAAADLDYIKNLPGTKICMPGNHDYWWSSASKLRDLYPDPGMVFLRYDHIGYGDHAVCAVRGWLCPGDHNFDPISDAKIYERELTRLETTLDAAKKAGYKKMILAAHFPPAGESFKHAGFFNVIKRYPVEKIIFGHLHGAKTERRKSFMLNNIECFLVSCDFLDFTPVRIL